MNDRGGLQSPAPGCTSQLCQYQRVAKGAVTLQPGAIIVLVSENNRVRMRINVAAAKANHLVISSKLLRPAEVVGIDAS